MAQEYGRYFGLQGRHLPRRLPDRARSTAASSCTDSSRYLVKCRADAARPTGSSATRASRSATTSTPRRAARHPPLRPRRRAPARSTTSAAAARTAARSSRRPTWSRSSAAARLQDRVRRQPRAAATTSATSPTCSKLEPHYPGWKVEISLRQILARDHRRLARAQAVTAGAGRTYFPGAISSKQGRSSATAQVPSRSQLSNFSRPIGRASAPPPRE